MKLFDVYNQCNLNYYLMALGVSVQTVSGASNFVTNTLWRVFYDDYRLITESILARDNQLAGRLIGSTLKEWFQVEIPESGAFNF